MSNFPQGGERAFLAVARVYSREIKSAPGVKAILQALLKALWPHTKPLKTGLHQPAAYWLNKIVPN